jgi:1-acyl-sn-glycerol-3-phosphate acyltransferase
MQSLRKRQPGQPLWRVLWWHLLHFICFLWFVPMYRFRAWGVKRVPEEGPLLVVSNHQSFFDPIIVGLGAHKRQFYALARSGLFKNKVLSWLIRSLNAVPVEQDGGDSRALRQCASVLKDGHALLVFPEGSRTLSGRVEPFAPGTMLLLKRAKPTVLPVALEGAYAVWPRGQTLPKLTGRIGVMYGEPIAADELLKMGSDEALQMLRQRIQTMQDDLAERLARERPTAALQPSVPEATMD